MKKLLAILVLLFTTMVFSQRKVTEGSFKSIQGISSFNLEFDYEGVMIPNYDSEEEFLADKMKKREDKKPGDGERFKKEWFADRQERYEPRFIGNFNKIMEKRGVQVGVDVGSEYTMIVKTTLIWPGYNIVIGRMNSKLSATISVYKNDNPSELLVSGTYKKVEGGPMSKGRDFHSGDRIAQAYQSLAFWVARSIRKGK